MFHTELKDRWNSFSLCEQMAHIGVEGMRIFSWKKKGKTEMSTNALYRCLELIDMTIADAKNKTGLKELCRVREFLVDSAMGENRFQIQDTDWETYFTPFFLAARRSKP